LKQLNLHSASLGIAALLLLISLGLVFTGNIESAGPVIIFFFLALAIGFRGYDNLKGFSYTTLIFAAVVMALYYPMYFKTIGDFKLTGLITPLIQIIMFGMGTSMSAKDFAAVIKTPRGV
jgi:BASS family bile acid:Na+ symporter